MAVVTELIAALGIELKKEDIEKINGFENKIKSIGESFTWLGQKVLGTEGTLKDFFFGAVNSAQSMMNIAKATGLSTDAFQQWQYAAKATGVSANNIITDIQSLRSNYFMNEKSILHMADSFKRMSVEGAAWWGNQYGISRDMVVLLRQGSDYIKKLILDAPVIPEEELKKAAEFNMKLEAAKEKLKSTTEQIVLRAAPALEEILNTFNNWIASDPGRMEFVIKGITAALIAMGSAEIIGGIANTISMLKGLAILLSNPVVLGLTAAAGGVYLLYEAFKDLLQKMTPEQIAGITGAFEGVGAVIQGIADAIIGSFDFVWRTVQTVFGGIGTLIDWLINDRTWNGLKERMKSLGAIWEDFAKEEKTPIIKPKLYTAENMASASLIRESGLSNNKIMSLQEAIAAQTSIRDITGGKDITFDGATFNIYTTEALKEVMNSFENEGVDVGSTGFGRQI